MGTTKITAGIPSYTWNGNVATVTIVVTHDSDTFAWTTETRTANHIFLPFGGSTTLLVGSSGFPNGTPMPGGGGKSITYTFTVMDGWDWTFDATMSYKLTMAAMPTTMAMAQIKLKAKKPQ